jgi:hypothetical protein
MAVQPNQKLGRYELIREVARSNDIVFEGWDPVTHRRVAVKVLNVPATASEPQKADRKQRFDREARAAARLHHANIVTLFDYGSEGESDFLVFEYIEGPTLADVLLQTGPLDSAAVRDFGRQLLSALTYAHAQGVVHRDIKPSNVFVCDGARLKISDLGIARIESEASVTTDGQIFGTPAYMAPEQVRGLDIDRRVDLWAAGVVLYQMSTGEQPFKGGSVLEIGSSVLNDEPMLDLVRDPGLRDVIGKALQKEPQERFQTAREMILSLDSGVSPPVARVTVAPAAPPSPVTVKMTPLALAKKGGRRRLVALWLATCFAAAALGAGAVAYIGHRGETPKTIPPPVAEHKLPAQPLSFQDVYREAWEHNSLHELADSAEFHTLALGAQSDKIDTWCRESIGKDYLALSQENRTALVAQLMDQFQADDRIAALNRMPSPPAAINGLARGPSGTPQLEAPSGSTGIQSSKVTDTWQPLPAGTAPVNVQPSAPQSTAPPPPQRVASNLPTPNSPAQLPEQRAHDLDDLEVLRKLDFVPNGPPQIVDGGVRIYTRSDGSTVRVR